MDDALVTPEAVVLDLAVASVPTRMLAALVDVAVQLLVLLVATLAGAFVFADQSVVTTVAISLVVFATQLVYPTVLEWRFGATLGQLALGLRVVAGDGGRPTLRQTATRTAVGILELEGTFGLLALLSATFHPRGRRLGDVAAGTLVVRVRQGERAEVLAATVPSHLRGWAASLDVAAFGQQERAALRRYLSRRAAVPAATREALARDLAGRLLPLTASVAPPGAQPDDVVVALAAIVGRSTGGPRVATRTQLASAAPPVPAAPGQSGPRAPLPPPPPTPGTQSATGFVPPA